MPSRETFVLGFLLIAITGSLLISSVFGILAKDIKCPTISSNSTINEKPSISIFTDKIRYMQGELVQVSGSVCDKEGKPSQERIIIQSSQYLSSDWLERLYQKTGEMLRLSDNPTSKPQIVYKTSIFSTNGSYTTNILNTQIPGSYNITATLENFNETSFTMVEVENPINTSTAKMELIGVASFVLLLIFPGLLLKWFGIQNGIHAIEKPIFCSFL